MLLVATTLDSTAKAQLALGPPLPLPPCVHLLVELFRDLFLSVVQIRKPRPRELR